MLTRSLQIAISSFTVESVQDKINIYKHSGVMIFRKQIMHWKTEKYCLGSFDLAEMPNYPESHLNLSGLTHGI